MPHTILAVDDDPKCLDLLDEALALARYTVLRAESGERALALAKKHHPDLVLLDIVMPGLDGLEVCRRLRGDPLTASIPVILVTGLAGTVDQILGLENGADDYVTKPFDLQVLVARVKAQLRRARLAASSPDQCIRTGTLVIDVERHQVKCDDRRIELTLAEFKLLAALASPPGRVRSRKDLLGQPHLEGPSAAVGRAVDAHIVALRRKLGATGDRIESVRGLGYRLREEG